MRITFASVSRRPSWPLWAVLIVSVWAALALVTLWVSVRENRPVELCLFKALTHIPCPTCGLTRGTWQLLHGRIIRAWLFNPLMFSIGMIILVHTGIRMFFARALHIRLTGRERTIAWILGFILLFSNWAYVVIYVG